jgi:hypothetical protein
MLHTNVIIMKLMLIHRKEVYNCYIHLCGAWGEGRNCFRRNTEFRNRY